MNASSQAESEALVGEVLTVDDHGSEASRSRLNDPPAQQSKQFVLKKLNNKHKQIISMALQGESRETVAEAIGCTPNYVSMILRQPLAKAYIEELNSYLDTKMVGLYEKSIDAIDRGLGSKNGQVSLAAAKLALQATGKLQPSKEAERTAEDVVANILNVGGTVVIGGR